MCLQVCKLQDMILTSTQHLERAFLMLHNIAFWRESEQETKQDNSALEQQTPLKKKISFSQEHYINLFLVEEPHIPIDPLSPHRNLGIDSCKA